MKLIVLTPSRGSVSLGHRKMLAALAAALRQRGDHLAFADDTTSGLLHHSRNVLAPALLGKGIDAGLWLDSDVHMPIDPIFEMVSRPEEFIVWNYPVRLDVDLTHPAAGQEATARHLRGRPRRWASQCEADLQARLIWSEDKKLVQINRSAFGAVLMKPSAIQEMAKHVRATRDWSGRFILPAFDLLENRIGEDYSFCLRYTAMTGRKIWCDPSVYVTNGSAGGRFADEIARVESLKKEYLMRCVAEQQA